jgi:predicted Ser/Thr protein kinase
MEKVDDALSGLSQQIKEREHRIPIPLREFMHLAGEQPTLIFRNIFQRFHDMIESYAGETISEYPGDPEYSDYVYYDTSKLFVDGTDHPFFADRLFANRLINNFAAFRYGIQQNRIYIFEGPHGSGKSTFLNNLLQKFEQYSRSPEGCSHEIIWRLDKKELGTFLEQESPAIIAQLKSLAEDSTFFPRGKQRIKEAISPLTGKDYLELPCPSHDHPLLIIPKNYRRELFDQIIQDQAFKDKLFSEKQYEWVFRDNPCTICISLYQTLLDIFDSPAKVFDMVFARRYDFDRRLGQGISVFNPGDKITKVNVVTNQLLQNQLNNLLRDSNRVRYLYSRYANTNNGIYAIMDVKSYNVERFANLHGIISEGVHKVEEDIEENVNSLFLALMNPEDRGNISGTQSFTDRISFIKIPYVLDYNTEVKIYRNIFGDQIAKQFLPRVLENFAKVIISTRLNPESETLREWIGQGNAYRLYCDDNLLLLKMDIYTGTVPPWLTEDHRKQFTAKRRKAIIAESENEGVKGFSGRDSIQIFNDFYKAYAKEGSLINMAMVCKFFGDHRRNLAASLPAGFLDSLINSYNYAILQEVKESLYYYNEERISRDIKNYLFATNFEPKRMEKCIFTGEMLEITEDFFKSIEVRLLGTKSGDEQRRAFRQDVQHQYASQTLTQELLVEGKAISHTTVYQALRQRYIHNLKEKVLDPFVENENFRRAIKDFATDHFKTYDKRIREEVTSLMRNLTSRYQYSEQGGKEVCIYVIDNNLAQTYSSS